MSRTCNCSHDHAAMNAALDKRSAERDQLRADRDAIASELAATRAENERLKTWSVQQHYEYAATANQSALADLRERAAKWLESECCDECLHIADAIRALPLTDDSGGDP